MNFLQQNKVVILKNLEIAKEGHLGTWVRPKMSELPELDPKMQFE